MGTGVIFLSPDPNELVSRHQILYGALQAGNTGVFNEINAINNRLLNLRIFDKKIIQKLNIKINDKLLG